MLDNEDSLVASLVKVQIDSSRDTMAFFQKVHRINRLSLDQVSIPHWILHLSYWIAAAVGIWLVWTLLRPVVGPFLGLAPAVGVKYTPPGRPNPPAHVGIAKDSRVPGGNPTTSTPRMGKSGLVVSKRPKPKKGSGPSLPRW